MVYIDDILVFSKDLEEHYHHLYQVFTKFLEQGLIISKRKVILAQEYIECLGLKIGKGKVKLQPHISTSWEDKIVNDITSRDDKA